MTAHDPALVEKVLEWLPYSTIPDRQDAIAVLDAVADDLREQGAVAALREAATWIVDDTGTTSGNGIGEWLRARADRIERGAP